MIWSFSAHNTFRRCQRQWYYKSVYAHWNAKDPARKEAWRLSKLVSLPAWRGNIVDGVISRYVIPAHNEGRTPTCEQALQRARSMFLGQRQLLTAANNSRMLKKLGDQSFAGFREVEYGEQLGEEDFHRVWDDIKKALSNFFDDSRIQNLLQESKVSMPQRPLAFLYDGVSVRAVPDVICFYHEKSPAILDWKLHANPIYDYWTQLASYAIALSRCKPHKDWPALQKELDPTEIVLAEIQLLSNEKRRHSLTEQDVEDIEDLMSESIEQMSLAYTGLDRKYIKPQDFPSAFSPTSCRYCAFKKLCWEGEL